MEPKSKKRLPPGSILVSIWLSPTHIVFAKDLGDKKITKGIRRALDIANRLDAATLVRRDILEK